ncbi:uncharacterized protein si:dkeyp-97b10.3 isoform X1 [Synchiropus splendidus]|uniref:uncharacterized protein si:dkeyp-97b10.3 isoform X1 n=1 Tax=Synchiropus splendidus TaxID=270530 RepID=UPI00237DFD28|nr:uncharacterized protein si:dkeyp-97b10.3 isoform X1 [Synchiropus splendidus]
MVAKMAIYGAAHHQEDGDEEIPAQENKVQVTESDGNSSAEGTGSSTEESSGEEEEEDHEKKEESEGNEGGESSKTESELEATQEEKGSTSMVNVKPREHRASWSCEKCKTVQQSHGSEVVVPRMLSKGRLQVRLEGEGTFECSVTGLVFEASEAVLVRYSILSWSKFGSFLPESWRFAGPIFNVDTVDKDPSVLKFIQFPHSVCLADQDNERTFSVLHMKNHCPLIEPTIDHSGSHVKWHVSSLSPVGPIIQTKHCIEHHGVVLLYKQLSSDNNVHSFHVYLSTNSRSDIKDVSNQVRSYNNRYFRIEKPPTCKLEEGTYRLVSEPDGEIKPQELKFTLAVTKMKGYFEAFFEQPPPFKLSLIETNTEETVWSATIREGDCVDNLEKKPRKRTADCRQRSSSRSEEEEMIIKRPRWQDEHDGVKRSAAANGSADLSEKQLLQLSRRLGSEWKQVAIFLDLNTRDLDHIQAGEKDVNMQKLKMLVEWKKRQEPGKATAHHLRRSLQDLDDLPSEVHYLLRDLMENQAAQ